MLAGTGQDPVSLFFETCLRPFLFFFSSCLSKLGMVSVRLAHLKEPLYRILYVSFASPESCLVPSCLSVVLHMAVGCVELVDLTIETEKSHLSIETLCSASRMRPLPCYSSTYYYDDDDCSSPDLCLFLLLSCLSFRLFGSLS